MANICNPDDPLMGKAVLTIRNGGDGRLIIFGTMKVAPETMTKLPREIDSTGLIIIGGMGFKVDHALLGPERWTGMEHGDILCSPLNTGECEVTKDPITNKIACLDCLQFMDITEMITATEGK